MIWRKVAIVLVLVLVLGCGIAAAGAFDSRRIGDRFQVALPFAVFSVSAGTPPDPVTGNPRENRHRLS